MLVTTERKGKESGNGSQTESESDHGFRLFTFGCDESLPFPSRARLISPHRKYLKEEGREEEKKTRKC